MKDSLKSADIVIIATPSKAFELAAKTIAETLPSTVPVGFLTKGLIIKNDTIETLSSTLKRILSTDGSNIAAISGPSHAEEVALSYYTCLTAGSSSPETRGLFSRLITCSTVSCRETDDITGVELGAALKNPAAIAAGILSNTPGCGDNLAGALMSQALIEMLSLGRAMGARDETIVDITGMGDLIATSLSDLSRNRRFGKELGLKLTGNLSLGEKISSKMTKIVRPHKYIEKMGNSLGYLAEGAYAIEPLVSLANQLNVSIPVYSSLLRVLNSEVSPTNLVHTVMNPHIHPPSLTAAIPEDNEFLTIGGIHFKKNILNSVHRELDNIDSESLKNLRPHLPKSQEKDIIASLAKKQKKSQLRKLTTLYINSIADRYSRVLSNVLFLLSKFSCRRRMSTAGAENLKFIPEATVKIYLTQFKNARSSAEYIKVVKKSTGQRPRFSIAGEGMSRFKLFLQKREGGFFIDWNSVESNSIYKQVVIQYLYELLKHNIPVAINYSCDYSQTIRQQISSTLETVLKKLYYNSSINASVNCLTQKKVTHSGLKRLVQGKQQYSIIFSKPLVVSDHVSKGGTISSIHFYIEDIFNCDEII
jgi:glycerol-3-phosphate dehydrogenase (NAD(P)+)